MLLLLLLWWWWWFVLYIGVSHPNGPTFSFPLEVGWCFAYPLGNLQGFPYQTPQKNTPKAFAQTHRQGSHPEWYPNLTKNSSILDFQKFMYERFPGAKKGWGHFLGGHWMSLAALLNPLFSLNLRLVVFLVQKSEVDTRSQKQWTCTWLNLVSTKWSMFQEFSMIFVCWQSIFGGHCHPNKIPTSHPSWFLYLAGTKSLYKKVASSIDL